MRQIAKGIYKRGKTYWYTIQQGGSRRFVSLKTDDEQEAIRRAALAKAHAPVSKAKEQVADTFKDQIERYLAAKDQTGSHTAATRKWSKRALLQFCTFILNKSAKSVKADDISGFYAALRKRKKPNGKLFSENAARSYLRAVRGFMSWTVTSKLRYDNPAKEVKLGKATQASRVRFATREQRAAIMEARSK